VLGEIDGLKLGDKLGLREGLNEVEGLALGLIDGDKL
jgi:hypothetical protein